MRPQYNWKLISIGFWLIILIILVILPVYGMELSVGESRYSYSGQVLVPIHLKVEKGESPTCASLDLQYNPDFITFQKIQIEKNLIQQGKIIQVREIRPGLVRILIYGLNENSLLSGNIAIAYFQHQNILLAGTTSLKINKALGATGKADKLPIQTKTARLNLNSGPRPINGLNNKFSLDLLLLLIVNVFILSNLKGQRSLGTPYPKVFGRRWVDWCTLKTRDRPPPFLTCLPPPLGASDNNCVKPTKCRPSNPPLKPSPILRNSTLNLITKSLNKIIKFCIFVALIFGLQWFILPQASTFAATYYVDKDNPSASDDNPGTEEARPWKTLTKAGNTAQAGDTVLVKAGIYNETLTVANSGTAGNLIIFKAYPGDECKGEYGGTKSDCRVVLDGQNTINMAVRVYPRNYIRIEGFEIRNYTWDATVYIKPYAGIEVEGVEIVNTYIHDNTGAIYARGGGTDVRNLLIENNDISNNIGDGILMGADGAIIRGNYIHDNGADGIVIGGNNIIVEKNHICRFSGAPKHNDGISAGSLTNSIIRYNRVHDFTQNIYGGLLDVDYQEWVNVEIYGNIVYSENYYYGGAPGEAPGIFIDPLRYTNRVDNISIHSNTFGWSGYDAIRIYGGTGVDDGNPYTRDGIVTNVKIRNNIFVDTGIAIGIADPAEVDSDYNLFYSAGAHSANPYGDECTAGHSICEQDPKFANYETFVSWDFHLQETSPAIDAGDPNLPFIFSLPTPFYDIDGNNRPQGSRYDIGAYDHIKSILYGDVSGDGKVNIQDVQCCVNHILGKQDWGTRADVNGDGKVDEGDVKEIINIILK